MMEGLLALVRAFGGRIEGRLRIQKSAYLLKVLGAQEFRRTRFRYHYYGPYSRELSGSLQQAVAGQLLEEAPEGFSAEIARYNYRLTKDGQRWLEGFESDAEIRLSDKIPLLQRADLKALELAATVAFLERDENLSRDDATRRALELKRDCVPHREEALRLLADLGVP